jgi:dihydrolipoamide dehydrogenase
MPIGREVSPIGSFTDPEYAQVGLTEEKARVAAFDIVVVKIPFDTTTRTIIDGQTVGFCKLIVDKRTSRILGCHIVGERAVDIIQIVAVAMTGGMSVDELARIPLSFPTYAGVIGRAVYRAACELGHDVGWSRIH